VLIYFFAGIQMSAAKVKQKKNRGWFAKRGCGGRFAKSAVKQAGWSAHVKGAGPEGGKPGASVGAAWIRES